MFKKMKKAPCVVFNNMVVELVKMLLQKSSKYKGSITPRYIKKYIYSSSKLFITNI